MHEELFKKLTGTVYTVQDFHGVLGVLKIFFDTYFFKKHKGTSLSKAFTTFIKNSEEANNFGQVWKSIDADFLNAFTKENSNLILHELENAAREVPHLTLYVPVLLPYVEVEQLSLWARKNVAQGILLDIKVDALAVGGCNLVWKGTYHDYSMQHFIEKKQGDLRDMLRTIKR